MKGLYFFPTFVMPGDKPIVAHSCKASEAEIAGISSTIVCVAPPVKIGEAMLPWLVAATRVGGDATGDDPPKL